MMSLWDELQIEDFETGANRELARTIGLAAMKKLIAAFGGESVYLSKPESVIRARRDRKIYEEYMAPGSSYLEIARKYSLTVRHVRKIVKEQRALDGTYIKQQELF